MREILFRGKSVEENNMVIGSYWKGLNNKHFIRTIENRHLTDYEVIPETVSQYTGLTDKNGKQIFEGDIVCILDMFSSYHYFVIHYKNGCFGGLSFDDFIDVNLEYAIKCNDIEVIGNKWDNPELMEKRK